MKTRARYESEVHSERLIWICKVPYGERSGAGAHAESGPGSGGPLETAWNGVDRMIRGSSSVLRFQGARKVRPATQVAAYLMALGPVSALVHYLRKEGRVLRESRNSDVSDYPISRN
jgi:hypothetical protein